MSNHAAQYLWNAEAGTFERNGQWLEYSVNFKINQPYQLLLRARTDKNAQFMLKIYTTLGDTVFSRGVNLEDDFENQGGGNEETDWLLSSFAIPNIMGPYIVQFDWYDNLAEEGIFGSFAFTKSTFDVTPPGWYYFDVGTFTIGTELQVATTEEGKVYLVPSETPDDTGSIYSSAVTEVDVTAYAITMLSTTGLNPGVYIGYAVDESGNVSEASREITLEKEDISTNLEFNHSPENEGISIHSNPYSGFTKVSANSKFKRLIVYNLVGKKEYDTRVEGNSCEFPNNHMLSGIYLVQVWLANDSVKTMKYFKKH